MTPRKPQIIVCGLGKTGYRILQLLAHQGANVVGVSDRPLDNPPDVHPPPLIVGDLRAANTLIKAGVKSAKTLLLTSSDDALNLAVLTQARLLNPKIRVINRLFNVSLGDRLDHTLADHVSLSVAALAAPILAFAAQGNDAIGQLHLADRLWPIQEEVIHGHHAWLGKPLSELWEDRNRMLIYYLPAQGQVDLITAITQGHVLNVGDRLIVAARPKVKRAQRSLLQQWERGLNLLHQFRQQIQSGIAITLILLLLIGGATLAYTSLRLNTSIVDALYFTVGMITGAGGNEEVAEQAPAIIKILTAVLMLIGTAVIGICYAILNDLVLGVHFKTILNAVHLPRQHHYIVCGLGGVGFQIMQHLVDDGHEVVVVEQDPNNRFLSAAHALKIPVIIGNANVSEVLESAKIATASALIAVTSDDTTNLEIALTAKALSPAMRIVVRNQDPVFAHQIKQVFEFEVVLSPTELAAPSFAAAALGGRLLGNGMAAGILWVAIATLITPSHPFFGKCVREVATTVDVVPLYIEAEGRTLHGWDLLDFNLDNGDVLYLTMPANRLDLLWRETAPSTLMPQPS